MTPYYEDSSVTIYHGDCREILPSIGRVDLVLTDPPYGINFAAQPTRYQRLNGEVPRDWDVKINNDLLFCIIRLAKHSIIWGGNYYYLPRSRGWLVWIKPDAPPSMATLEMAWTNVDRNAKHIFCAHDNAYLPHPTRKPIKVITWSMDYPPTAETILDPFMGSGTTLRAAKDLGRKAIGIEIEEKYCEIAAKRMSQEVLDFANPR